MVGELKAASDTAVWPSVEVAWMQREVAATFKLTEDLLWRSPTLGILRRFSEEPWST